MRFLAPAALGALALVAIPVLIHLLQRPRARRLEFPSLRFLLETPSLARRLARVQNRSLLALRMAIVAIAALAFAHPIWLAGPEAAALEQESAVVVLLDASASMSRPDVRERTIAAVRERLGVMTDRELVRVAEFDSELRWLSDFQSPEIAARALDAYAPTTSAARLERVAGDLRVALREAPQALKRVLLASDFQAANGTWSQDLGDSVVEPLRIPNEYHNAYPASVKVYGGSDEPTVRVGWVESAEDGTRLEVAELALREGEARDGLRIERVDGSWQVRVTAVDEFDADDARRFDAQIGGELAVAGTSDAIPYLAAAADTLSFDGSATVAPGVLELDLEAVTHLLVDAGALAEAGAAGRLVEWATAGGTVIAFTTVPLELPAPRVGASGDIAAGAILAPVIGERAGARSQLDDLLLESQLRNVAAVEPAEGDDVLLSTLDGAPLAVRRRAGEGSITIVGIVPEPESLPLVREGDFPEFVARLGGLGPERDSLEDARNVPLAESDSRMLSDGEVAALFAGQSGATERAQRSVDAELERRQQGWRVLLALAILLTFVELAWVLGRARRAGEPT